MVLDARGAPILLDLYLYLLSLADSAVEWIRVKNWGRKNNKEEEMGTSLTKTLALSPTVSNPSLQRSVFFFHHIIEHGSARRRIPGKNLGCQR